MVLNWKLTTSKNELLGGTFLCMLMSGGSFVTLFLVLKMFGFFLSNLLGSIVIIAIELVLVCGFLFLAARVICPDQNGSSVRFMNPIFNRAERMTFAKYSVRFLFLWVFVSRDFLHLFSVKMFVIMVICFLTVFLFRFICFFSFVTKIVCWEELNIVVGRVGWRYSNYCVIQKTWHNLWAIWK